MKPGIHPEYYETTIRCSCGNEIHTRATKKDIRIETCSACHPLFTGKARMMDTEGRVQRFMKKYGAKDGKRSY
jgi:large subunit ribosomal protein L31